MTNANLSKQLDALTLAKIIDHTILGATATKTDIRRICEEAKSFGAGSVCVNPYWVRTVADSLKDSETNVCTVVGFPLGASAAKAKETAQALLGGAQEIDMVANIGLLKEASISDYAADIRDVAREVKAAGGVLKVIIETCYLTNEQKSIAARTAAAVGLEVGVHTFVKTSTGFGTPPAGTAKGATIPDVVLLRTAVGPYSERHIGIKASGGIGDAKNALDMIIAAGGLNSDGKIYEPLRDVVRIGASAGVKIVNEYRSSRQP